MKEARFSELYVVSDLHIGDTRGQPIFDQAKELAELIDYLTKKAPPALGSSPLGANCTVTPMVSSPR